MSSILTPDTEKGVMDTSETVYEFIYADEKSILKNWTCHIHTYSI